MVFNRIILSFIFFLILIIFINQIDNIIYVKSLFYIIALYLIIYAKIKYSLKLFVYFIILISAVFINNFSQNQIIEKSSILKINESHEIYYKKIFKNYYPLLKLKFIDEYKFCYEDYKKCFNDNFLKQNYISIDQGFFNIDKNIARKINDIEFNSIDTLRPGFINDRDSKLNFDSGIKIKNTPYYIEYNNLPKIKSLCFKGNIIIYSQDTNLYESKKTKCMKIENDINKIIGFQLGENELAIKINKSKNYKKLFNYIFILLFLSILIKFIDYKSLYEKKFFLNISVALSTLLFFFLIYYLSEFNPTNGYVYQIAQFNPLSSYYLMAQNMDGRAYLELLYKIYNQYINQGFTAFLEGGNQVFWYNPGFRYFLVLEKLLFGDYSFLQILIILILPKIIYLYLANKIDSKSSDILIILFLFYPLLILKFIFPNIHEFFNYYQIILHTFWGMSEPLALCFILSGLYFYFLSYKKNIILTNILFYFAVLCKPHYLITVFVLVFIKLISEIINRIKIDSIIIYLIILILYLLPLIHNIHFGQTFVFFTEYGQSILSISNIINNYDADFYLDKFKDWKIFAMLLILILPKINPINKIILITQYLSLFYFEDKTRYEWLFIIILIESYLIFIINLRNKFSKKMSKLFTQGFDNK